MAQTSVQFAQDFAAPSCQGTLALLDEPDDELKVYALRKLNQLVAPFWAEIAEQLPKIESLFETPNFPERELAAYVASQAFYHLGEFGDALQYALGAGELFNVGHTDEYTDTIIARCIDEYVEQRCEGDTKVDDRLNTIVERMFKRCYDHGQFKQALGIALESRRLDHVQKSILESGDIEGMLDHTYKFCETVIENAHFRDEVLKLLLQLYRKAERPDYENICRCHFQLNDPVTVSKILWDLVRDDELMAFQVAFDLAEYENPAFLSGISSNLPNKPEPEAPPETPALKTADANTSAPDAPKTTDGEGDDDNAQMQEAPDATEPAQPAEAETTPSQYANVPDEMWERLQKLRSILSGDLPTARYLDYLFRENNADMLILKKLKDAVPDRSSVLNSAVNTANGLMLCGTTIDQFLRDNLDWMGKAANWAKFSATANLGMIQKGHHSASLDVLSAYLPGSGGGPYQEGGALYALGLIHSKDGGNKMKEYLYEALKNAGSNEIIQHGACLALGIVAMGTHRGQYYEQLKEILYQDRANPGEAAGVAMGLLMAGCGNSAADVAIEEMLQYAHETSHEKIIRGLAMGIAISFYGVEEGADTIIEQMTRDKDPILRYGGCYAIALAYACTGNNSAIRRLLHLAVSDVENDVRRAATIGIGFVLGNQPDQVPKAVRLLAKSYNPAVRYGAAAALAVACSGSANPQAIELLKKLIDDNVDYVRQAALISMGMVLMQRNSKETPYVEKFREKLMSLAGQKYLSKATRMGAILAFGMLDAGGRNVTISLMSPGGQRRMGSVIGMAMFWQYWQWFPYIPFISMTFRTSMLMAINKDLEMPKIEFLCNAPKSRFAYPPATKVEKEDRQAKCIKVELSTAKKDRARKAARKKVKDGVSGDGDATMSEPATPAKGTKDGVKSDATDADKKVTFKENSEEEEKKEEEKPEMEYHMLANPSRVTSSQQALIEATDARYRPVAKKLYGFVMLRDLKPGEKTEIVELKKLSKGGVHGDEPDPPAPFEYLG